MGIWAGVVMYVSQDTNFSMRAASWRAGWVSFVMIAYFRLVPKFRF